MPVAAGANMGKKIEGVMSPAMKRNFYFHLGSSALIALIVARSEWWWAVPTAIASVIFQVARLWIRRDNAVPSPEQAEGLRLSRPVYLELIRKNIWWSGLTTHLMYGASLLTIIAMLYYAFHSIS